MKNLFLIVFLLILHLVLAGATAAQVEKEPIRIGVIYAFSGPLAYMGETSMQGLSIATDMINEKGGINGRKIILIKGDAVNPQAAMSEAERLIKQERVPIIIGTYASGLSLTASGVAERNKVVYLEDAAAADSLTQRGFNYFFRITVKVSQYGAIAADYCALVVAPKLGKKPSELKAVVMHESSMFGTELSKYFMEQAKKHGINILEVMKYDYKDRDFSSIIMRLKTHKPDILYDACYTEDFIVFWRQAKELDYKPPVILGGGTLGEIEVVQALGKDIEGANPCYAATFGINEKIFQPETLANRKEFFKRMESKYKITVPAGSAFSGFNVGSIFFNHVLPKVKNPDNSEEIRQALINLDLPIGSSICGYGVKFKPFGEPDGGQNERSFTVVMQWQDGRICVVYPERMATRKPLIPMPAWTK